jgi:hypothetical protein
VKSTAHARRRVKKRNKNSLPFLHISGWMVACPTTGKPLAVYGWLIKRQVTHAALQRRSKHENIKAKSYPQRILVMAVRRRSSVGCSYLFMASRFVAG